MKQIKFLLILLLLTQFTTTSCASRREPKPKTAQSVAHSFLKKYGRKYDNTIFTNNHIEKVTINAIEEIHYKTVFTDALVYLDNGQVLRTLFKMEKHFPSGWNVATWEIIDRR